MIAGLIAAALAGCTSGQGYPGSAPTGNDRQSDAAQLWDNSSPFGTVKGGVGDTVIAPGWVKTIWTPQVVAGTSVNPDVWRSQLQNARKHDQIELPVVADDAWKSGNIDDIKNVMRQLFQADPRIPAWEMGIEENLQPGWAENLPETAEKLAAVKEVKDSVNPDIKLAYQIVDTTGSSVETFLKSEASDYIDIIAVHPYAWPDFKDPDLWLDRFLAKVHRLETAYDKNLPVWFTEVGAPTDEAGVQLYSGSRPASGLTPREQADYLTKVYATALNDGVERIFWYEYEDSCSTPSDVECHFGLKQYDGTPKPAYYAYEALSNCLTNKKPAGKREQRGVTISSFESSSQACHVVWDHRGSSTTFSLRSLGTRSGDARAFDVTGHPLPVSGEEVRVSGSPVLLETSR